jgi:hypothetical protein
MRTLTLAVLLTAGLALAACSKSTQEKTGDDLKAVGADASAAAKDVANAPAAKELGSDIKDGAKEAAAKTKVAADEAGEKLKAGASEAGDRLKSGTEHAASDIKSGTDKAAARTDAAVDHAKDKVEH